MRTVNALGDPDTGVDGDVLVGEPERSLKGEDDATGNDLGVARFAETRKKKCELVTAEPRGGVVPA